MTPNLTQRIKEIRERLEGAHDCIECNNHGVLSPIFCPICQNLEFNETARTDTSFLLDELEKRERALEYMRNMWLRTEADTGVLMNHPLRVKETVFRGDLLLAITTILGEEK